MDMTMSAAGRRRRKKINWLTQDKWEIQGGNFSPDGKTVTWTAM